MEETNWKSEKGTTLEEKFDFGHEIYGGLLCIFRYNDAVFPWKSGQCHCSNRPKCRIAMQSWKSQQLQGKIRTF